MKKKLFLFVVIISILGLVAGCAPGAVKKIDIPGVSLEISVPGQNPLAKTADANNHTAGVLLGIWHGIISPVTLVLSFVNPDLQMYEVYNDGSLYNLGFLLGVAIVFGLLGLLVGSRRH